MNAKLPVVLAATILAFILALGDDAHAQQSQAEERAEKAEERADRLEKKAEKLSEKAAEGDGDRAEKRAKKAEKKADRAREKAERLAEKEEQRESARSRVSAAGNAGGDAGPKEVTLSIEGDRGTRFAGTCAVGDETRSLDGEVPQRFRFSLPEGERLECEIRNQGNGSLKVVLAAPGARSVQQTNAGTINLSYGG